MPDVASRPPPIATEPASGPYAGYEGWKRWDRLFAPTADERAYFAGETRGLVIAGGALLEIGFGSGSFLAWAREMGARVCGVEVIPVVESGESDEGLVVRLLFGAIARDGIEESGLAQGLHVEIRRGAFLVRDAGQE